MTIETIKTPGQLAYEEELRRCPNYPDGSPRPAWDDLTSRYGEWLRKAWEMNPTPRTYGRSITG